MARSPAAAARLEAVAAANRLHADLDLRRRVTQGQGFIDIFEAIGDLGIPLVFKPLDSALGLCLPAPLRGIMITARRGLHIQRFTAAHELGHDTLGHQGSIDQEILERGPNSPWEGRDLQEVAAEAFAAEFLLPRWLYRHHIQAQGWTLAHDLRRPETIYQLSLRMVASYEATCWGLLSHQILPYDQVRELNRAKLGELKAGLGEGHKPTDSWADVWKVTQRDNGATLLGNPDDLLRIELEESPSSGHRWGVEELPTDDWELLEDQSQFQTSPVLYGAPSRRVVVARPRHGGLGRIALHERHPWAAQSPDNAEFQVAISLHGPERPGLSRIDRERLGLHQ
ncbi:MAG: protease inhibitor I42 family protein [Novosphingobium sp.]